jgi:hypothetical protein
MSTPTSTTKTDPKTDAGQALAPASSTALVTSQGKTTIADTVVEKIAGLAA